MTTTIRNGDVGTLVKVNAGCDISDAQRTGLLVTKPNGTTKFWSGTVVENNYIAYTTQAGDIDIVGHWKLQTYVETLTGRWSGDLTSFKVESRLFNPTTTTTTTV
jgi:hypothetical protein